MLKEQVGILTHVQVCRIIKLKFNLELNLLKAFVDKLNASDSYGSEFDDSKGSNSERGISAYEGLDSDDGSSASGDNLDSGDLNLMFSTSGSYSVSIADISCQHHT